MVNEIEQHIATIEFSFQGYDARAKNTARIGTITATSTGVRVKIEAEAPEGNCRFVTISDDTMSAEFFNQYVRPTILGSPNFVIRHGHL